MNGHGLPPKLKFLEDYKNTRSEFYESFKFRIVSSVRIKLPKKKRNVHQYLNLGCGRNIIANFDNADTYVIRQNKVPFIGLDLRKRFPFENEIYAGIFCEHTLEHLRFDFALNCLGEVYRILKKDGILRIIVPDLDIYLLNSIDKTSNREFLTRFSTTAQSLSSLTQSWGHKSLWNFEILEEFLLYVGFRNVQKFAFQMGTNPALLVDQENRQWESLYVEAVK
jgi:predicted SAM-dependent methyltransferase